MATDNSKPAGPDHSTRSTNTKLPGIVKPGAAPKPKVKITQGAPPAKPAN